MSWMRGSEKVVSPTNGLWMPRIVRVGELKKEARIVGNRMLGIKMFGVFFFFGCRGKMVINLTHPQYTFSPSS